MRRIPSSFQIGSYTFTVERVDDEEMLRLAGQAAYGLFVPDQLKLFVIKSSRTLKEAVARQAFWHEYAHAMLWTMSHREYGNEKVIDHIGHCLKQTMESAKFG